MKKHFIFKKNDEKVFIFKNILYLEEENKLIINYYTYRENILFSKEITDIDEIKFVEENYLFYPYRKKYINLEKWLLQ